MIFVTGSTRTRTRLYRMGISNNIEAIKVDFEVFGLVDDKWLAFKKGVEFEAFLVKRKKMQFYNMKQAKNTSKKPTTKVDKNLDKYLEKGLFKEKIDKANKVLKTVGLPRFAK
jgi:hypothetical protein